MKMFRVIIKVNDQEIENILAQNISEECGLPYGKGKQIYVYRDVTQIGEGFSVEAEKLKTLTHNFEDGAIVLAKKLLSTKLKKKRK